MGGVDGLARFEERLDAVGWGSADWHLVGNDPGVGLTAGEIQESGRPVTDLTGVRPRHLPHLGDDFLISLGEAPEGVLFRYLGGSHGYFVSL